MSYINKPGKTTAWRNHVLNNLAADVILYEKVETSLSMALSLTKLLSKLITWAKKTRQNPEKKQHFYRLALKYLVSKKNVEIEQNQEKTKLLNKLFNELGERYQERPGGYTRITKHELRRGDNNLRVVFALV